MDTRPAPGLLLAELAALAVPMIFALAAILVAKSAPFRRANFAAAAAMIFSAVAACLAAWGGVAFAPLSPAARLVADSVRLDAVASVMLGLVTFISFIIVRFSRAYLGGDGGQARYVRWLMATLAAVALLIVSNNLLLMAGAWVATSLCLHQLLTFYAERPYAQVAAHKKFLVSRVADLCLLTGIGLIGTHVGSLNLEDIAAWATRVDALPYGVHAAALLLVVAAALKCAQLPFHGWLTQVMEAPTPVSALLHAGVVNIGGFLMIRLAPLMVKAQAAQTLLVLIGCTTAVVAALVMTTRVSIKVALAWSTCAQMGFMLVQCGLGVYHLALLHIVGHSLYKAHAFLSTGSVVDRWRLSSLVAARPRSTVARSVAAAATALGVVFAVGTGMGANPSEEPALWALGLVLALALTPLLLRASGQGGKSLATVALGSLAVTSLYFIWHASFGHLIVSEGQTADLSLRVFIVAVNFVTLFALQTLMHAQPHGRLARVLYPRLFAGLYLDEIFTRLTFRLWPPKMPEQTTLAHALHVELRKA